MSVSDAAGNLASFTQTLTVDTVPPVVTITGGATATTSDVDPTITGNLRRRARHDRHGRRSRDRR